MTDTERLDLAARLRRLATNPYGLSATRLQALAREAADSLAPAPVVAPLEAAAEALHRLTSDRGHVYTNEYGAASVVQAFLDAVGRMPKGPNGMILLGSPARPWYLVDGDLAALRALTEEGQ